MPAWFNRDDLYPDWEKLLPYVGTRVTVEYTQCQHSRWSSTVDRWDETCTGTLREVSEEGVVVGDQYLSYTERDDGFVEREIQRIRVEPAASREEQIRAKAYELYLQRGGASGGGLDDWLRAEQLVDGVRKAARREIFDRSTARLKHPEVTDADLVMAKLHPAAYVPSDCVRADGER